MFSRVFKSVALIGLLVLLPMSLFAWDMPHFSVTEEKDSLVLTWNPRGYGWRVDTHDAFSNANADLQRIIVISYLAFYPYMVSEIEMEVKSGSEIRYAVLKLRLKPKTPVTSRLQMVRDYVQKAGEKALKFRDYPIHISDDGDFWLLDLNPLGVGWQLDRGKAREQLRKGLDFLATHFSEAEVTVAEEDTFQTAAASESAPHYTFRLKARVRKSEVENPWERMARVYARMRRIGFEKFIVPSRLSLMLSQGVELESVLELSSDGKGLSVKPGIYFETQERAEQFLRELTTLVILAEGEGLEFIGDVGIQSDESGHARAAMRFEFRSSVTMESWLKIHEQLLNLANYDLLGVTLALNRDDEGYRIEMNPSKRTFSKAKRRGLRGFALFSVTDPYDVGEFPWNTRLRTLWKDYRYPGFVWQRLRQQTLERGVFSRAERVDQRVIRKGRRLGLQTDLVFRSFVSVGGRVVDRHDHPFEDLRAYLVDRLAAAGGCASGLKL